MDTKWKNRIALIAFVLLFTLGVRGLIPEMLHGGNYITRDYFQTRAYEQQLEQFIDYLSLFELGYVDQEEMKQQITVTADEINEHRYRYGELAQQIADIKAQYEGRILEAKQTGNQDVAEIYAAERDKKIEDITNNFKSDEHVRLKIVKEKEQKIDEYYRELENYRPEFAKLKASFKYYLKDTSTGEVYTNLTTTSHGEAEKQLSAQKMLVVHSYPNARKGYISTENRYNYINHEELITQKSRTFTGKIGVPKGAPATSLVQINFQDYQRKQEFYLFYAGFCVLALLTSIYLYRKLAIPKLIEMEDWQTRYNRIPLDVSVIVCGFTGLIALILLLTNNSLYQYAYLSTFIKETIFGVIFSTIFLGLTFIQGKLLLGRIGNGESLKTEWQTGILARSYQGLKEAFLIRSIGTQVTIILFIAGAFGGGAMLVLVEPSLILIYVPVFLLLGLPLLRSIYKQAGYFNRIVTNTSEIVQGNLEPDLPVKGKSSMATLAANINKLKYGVKTSRKEQAKSERLKTELITNVSHDLRTPLTSIITYTELLKKADLPEEDREAYVQIIDRKSKRLKVLIDDLFEASKMASGSIDLHKERVDLVQLLQQALAEHNEAITASNLQFRVAKPDKPVFAVVDGQKIWRVFDNLIGNILKYALEYTRVYIAVQTEPAQVIITFKNVTKYELGQDTDELFERFKRGDTSRHTEGSGLGLAIAKSIVDLHEGSLDIEVDGDLFKVTVTLSTMSD